MSYQIFVTHKFKKDVKYYKKKKKYFKIDKDIEKVVSRLEHGVLVGDEVSNLGLKESSYKVRVANSSINVGKSNGFRLIYYVIKDDKEIYLLTIYSKKDRENLPNEEIINLINRYC